MQRGQLHLSDTTVLLGGDGVGDEGEDDDGLVSEVIEGAEETDFLAALELCV